MAKVISAFTYNGEVDLLRLHVSMLNPFVDLFVIVEAETTFSGKEKPLYFIRDRHIINKYLDKVIYYVVDETDEDLWQQAELSPNTIGAQHWKREFYQKESIKKAIESIEPDDEDIVYIGDVDEVWNGLYKPQNSPEKLLMRVYAYYLDNQSNEVFWGTVVSRWGDIKHHTLNHVRSDTSLRTNDYAGWHFTSMGGLKEVRRKLNDSYTQESYNTTDVQLQLGHRMENGIDYLGRDFQFNINESDWPQYLKDNRTKYAHLCKGIQAQHSSGRGRYD